MIEISAARAGRSWELVVQENGIGIASEYHDRSFEMAERLHAGNEYGDPRNRLAVVRKIVERHGGIVRRRSTTGEGSTFSFTLPVT